MKKLSLKKTNLRKNKKDNQLALILLVCLPCLLVTVVSLFIANISLYLIGFIVIVLTLLCCYVAVASKQNSQYQVRTLSNLIESMIDGDYTLRGRVQTNPAFQELLDLINNLADTLAKHKIEAKESRLLLERIMSQMDAMVIATDDSGHIVMANTSAQTLLLGTSKSSLSVNLSTLPLGDTIKNSQTGIIHFSSNDDSNHGLTGEYFLFRDAFLSEGKQHQLYLITNAERLLMEKERNAWQSLLRVLSHELNNSLTPIAAISQSMQSKLKKHGDTVNTQSLLEGVKIINERADSLSAFISTYSQLSHLPKPNKSTFALSNLLEQVSGLFGHIDVTINDTCHINLNADKNQLEQILINLFKNADEAMPSSANKKISIYTNLNGKWQQIIISDYGLGIANPDNLFVPFYTTKQQGSGIGLALCRQIMFNHDGLIKLANRIDPQTGTINGVDATLSLPL